MDKISADSPNSIRDLNDNLRVHGRGGRLMMTVGIQALGAAKIRKIMEEIAKFNMFTEDNDPYSEHDFGKVVVDGIKVLWKIDYYDQNLEFGSPDPSDPKLTTRVMTVMCSDEY